MAIDLDHLLSLKERNRRVVYTDRDPMLYALAVGLGRGDSDQAELAFVTEHRGLRIMPTFATVLARSGLLDDCGWDAARVIPAAESLTLDRPLDEAGTLLVDTNVTAVLDRGPETGALISLEARCRREADGQPIGTVQRSLLARGDGGFGGPRGPEPEPLPLPARRPDLEFRTPGWPDQALLFRLLGDRTALHADPAAARRAGLSGPILHSQCLLGIACHGVLAVICEHDHTLIRSFGARYTGPVRPGEPLVLDLWQDANVVRFRLRAADRPGPVLDHGRCVLAA